MNRKTSRHLRPARNRSRIALAIIALIVFAFGSYAAYEGVTTLIDWHMFDQGANKVDPIRINPGDTLKMDDTIEEERDVKTNYGGEYLFAYPWSGTVEARIDQPAQLFSTPEDAGIGEPSHFDPDENYVLIAPITLKNVNATPSGTTRDGRPSFNISFFHVSGDNYTQADVSTIEELEETMSPDSPFDGYKFTLAPGEEKTLHVAYVVPRHVPTQYFTVGGGSTIPYYLEFDVEDHTA